MINFGATRNEFFRLDQMVCCKYDKREYRLLFLGAGKSTFLKLVSGANAPSDGQIRRHVHCKIGLYHQVHIANSQLAFCSRWQ